MLNFAGMFNISLIIGFSFALIIQILLYLYLYRVKYEKQQNNLMLSTIEVLKALDNIEEKIKRGNNMDPELKKVAQFLAKKIEEAKEEIVGKIDDLLEEAAGETEEEKDELESEEKEGSEFDEKDLDSYDELEDYKGDRKLETKPAEAPKPPKKEEKKKKYI